MVIATGLEPVTVCLEGRCSIQLSYATKRPAKVAELVLLYKEMPGFFLCLLQTDPDRAVKRRSKFSCLPNRTYFRLSIKYLRSMATIDIEASWLEVLKDEFEKEYFKGIRATLVAEYQAGHTVYPPGKLIFNAFNKTPFHQVKVVIIGQDPYHGAGQAMGLCFSVPKTIPVPASLKNIYKELHTDLGIPPADHGDLTRWTGQGVFLLNAMLTVRAGSPGSHARIGWQSFTDEVIRRLSDRRDKLVFLLWGNFARSKKTLIDEMKHYVLEAAHPSPLAGNRFSGCKHFSTTNRLLKENGFEEIDWRVGE